MSSLADLAAAYPKFATDMGAQRAASVAELYKRKLADIPPAVLAAALDELIATEEWFPTIAKIRSVCAERILALPDEGGALAQIEQRMAWAHQDESSRPETPPEVHLLVESTLSLLGGYSAFRAADEPAVIRGQFGRLYREARARVMREAQSGAMLALEPEGCGRFRLYPDGMAEDIVKAYIRLRSTKGHWFVEPTLRPKLVEDARAQDTSMTEVVVMILCKHLKIQHIPSGRRSDPKPDEELLNLRLPTYVVVAVEDHERAAGGRRHYTDVIREILAKHYKLKSYPARGPAELLASA